MKVYLVSEVPDGGPGQSGHYEPKVVWLDEARAKRDEGYGIAVYPLPAPDLEALVLTMLALLCDVPRRCDHAGIDVVGNKVNRVIGILNGIVGRGPMEEVL